MTIIELRTKRARVLDSARAFLESHRNEDGFLSAEDDAVYTKMEDDITNLGKEISRMERLEKMDGELSKPMTAPITEKPASGKVNAKTGRASDEYRQAFWNQLRRKGDMTPELRNALETGTDSEGGYLVPDEFEKTLVQGLTENGVIRSHAHVITTSGGLHKIPVVASHGSAAWIDEEGAYTESDDSFGQVQLDAHKVGTIIKASVPGVKVEFITDSTILADVRANGGPDKAVYDRIFSDVSVSSLPAPEKAADKDVPGKAATVERALSGVRAEDVTAFCGAHQLTENALFTAAFALLLARMGGSEEALFASIYNGRTRPETLRMMGMLVKTYPFYARCQKELMPAEYVRSVQAEIQELTANDLYSFAEATRDYDVNADVLFAYQGDSFADFTLAGQKPVQIAQSLGDAKGPLNVDVWKKGETYAASFEYREDLYTESQMRWMIDAYGTIVRGLMNQAKLGDIPLLSDEAAAFLNTVNDTDVPVTFRPVHCLMEEQAAKHPDRLAVVTPAAQVTYRELNESANRIAR